MNATAQFKHWQAIYNTWEKMVNLLGKATLAIKKLMIEAKHKMRMARETMLFALVGL